MAHPSMYLRMLVATSTLVTSMDVTAFDQGHWQKLRHPLCPSNFELMADFKTH